MDLTLEQLREWIDLESLGTRAVEFLPDLAVALAILVGFYLLYRVTRPALRRALQRSSLQESLIRLLVDSIWRAVLIVFGLVMAADQLGINVGAALAGLGVAGIAVGFAAQDSLSNMISGFLIFWDKPFRVGDWVVVADQYGKVQEITLRTTRIRTRQNTWVVIPNKHIIDKVLVNHSKHGETRIDVPLGIAYKENIPQAREVILAAIEGLEGVVEDPAPAVVVTELGDSSVNLEARVWIDDADLERPVYFRTIEAAKLALDAADIEIPFPHLQLFVDDVEQRVWDGAARTLPGELREVGEQR